MNRKRKKYGKLNLTLDQRFYNYLKHKAAEEHLPTSTYVKKYLMDQHKNNWSEYEENRK